MNFFCVNFSLCNYFLGMFIFLILAASLSASSYGVSAPVLEVYASKAAAESKPGYIHRDYEWYYKNKKWRMSYDFPADIYAFYHEIPRQFVHLGEIVTNEDNRKVLRGFIRFFKRTAESQQWNRRELAFFVTRFVQYIPYKSDKESLGEDTHNRFPVETLVDRAGECTDKSVLLAAMLDELGYDVALLYMRSKSGVNHMRVGISDVETSRWHVDYDGKKYFYLETVLTNAIIGEIPGEYRLIGLMRISGIRSDSIQMHSRKPYFVAYSGMYEEEDGKNEYYYEAIIDPRRAHLKIESDRLFPKQKWLVYITQVEKDGKIINGLQNSLTPPDLNKKWITLSLKFEADTHPYKVTVSRDEKGRLVFTAHVR